MPEINMLLAALETATDDPSVGPDAMRLRPRRAGQAMPLLGVYIPVDEAQPAHLVCVDEQDGVSAAITRQLPNARACGHPVAGVCFLAGAGQPHRPALRNTRATDVRRALCMTVVDGDLPTPDSDQAYARHLLAGESKPELCGPILVLGVAPDGSWRTPPHHITAPALLIDDLASRPQTATNAAE